MQDQGKPHGTWQRRNGEKPVPTTSASTMTDPVASTPLASANYGGLAMTAWDAAWDPPELPELQDPFTEWGWGLKAVYVPNVSLLFMLPLVPCARAFGIIRNNSWVAILGVVLFFLVPPGQFASADVINSHCCE